MATEASDRQTDSDGGLSTAAFALAAGIVLARCMINEIIRDPFDITPGAEAIPRSPGAITCVVLTVLSTIPPLLVILRAWLDSEFRLIRSWSHMLFGLLALWAMASAFWASDSFLSGVTSGGLLAAALLGWTMTQTVRSWARLRILAGLGVGLLLVLLAHAAIYHFVEVPQMREMWQHSGDTQLRQRGLEPGSFQAELFTKRVLAGEFMGFYRSPNSAAAVVVMCLLITIGATIQWFRNRGAKGWAVAGLLIVAASFWLIELTSCRTAFATPVLGVVLIVLTALLRGFTARHRKLAFCAGVLVVGLGIAAVVGHGLAHGNLVERSLTFRWHYWTASLAIFRDHWLHGVGWDNFGLFYPAYKLPFAPEDVKDPHNLLVRMFTELGAVGGILAVIWLLQLWWDMIRPTSAHSAPVEASQAANEEPSADPAAPPVNPVRIIAPVLWPATIATLITILATIDFSFSPLVYGPELLRRGLYGCLLLAGGLLVTLQSLRQPAMDQRPAPWLMRGILAGLAMFLLHNAIDFSFFEPGLMMLFLALAGAVTGLRGVHAIPAAKWAGIPLLLLALGYGLGIALPVIVGESWAITGDEQLRRSDFAAAVASYRDASAAPLPNADYAVRESRALSFAHADPTQILAALDRALAINPRNSQGWMSRGELRASLRPPDIPSVAADFDRATAIDPGNVNMRLAYARCMESLGQPAKAIEQYQEALKRDDALPQDEMRRLPEPTVRQIKARIQNLKEAMVR